jgi:hypothetical protein
VPAATGPGLLAVDGVNSFLYWFSVETDGTTGELRAVGNAPIPLPEPGVRVAVAGESILVVGRSGKLYPGPSFVANRLRLGLTSVAPLLRSSCEVPQAVVSAGGISATVVVPTSEGLSAFLEGAPNARFVDTVSFERDGGVPLAYYFSGGVMSPRDAGADGGPKGDLDGGVVEADSGPPPPGFLVSQTAAQIWDLVADGGLEKKSEFHFSARAGVAVARTDSEATLVVGGPQGVHFVALKAGELPRAEEALLDSTCPDVRALVPLRDNDNRVVALARSGGKHQLCMVDTKNSKVGQPVEVGHLIAAAAAATTRDGMKAVQHLFTVGWETVEGSQALVLRHSQGSDVDNLAPERLDWGSRVKQLLPTGGAPITAMAASPDGRRLLVAFAGEHPGLLAIDPAPFVGAGSEAEKAAAVTTLTLGAAPVGIGFTVDGAMAVIALSDDTLAFVR